MTTQTITIQSQQFVVPAPYAEGHVLTAGEAAALNQVLGENLRNNFAARIKRRREENEEAVKAGQPQAPELTQADLDAYAAEYQFGVRQPGQPAVVRDPVEAEARSIAKTAITEAIKAKGRKVKEFTKEALDGLIASYLDKYPQVREQAAAIVEQRKQAGAAAAADLGL